MKDGQRINRSSRRYLIDCKANERSDDLRDRLRALDTDELLIQATVEVRQLVRIESHLVQDRRVQVLDVIAILHAGAA